MRTFARKGNGRTRIKREEKERKRPIRGALPCYAELRSAGKDTLIAAPDEVLQALCQSSRTHIRTKLYNDTPFTNICHPVTEIVNMRIKSK